MTSELTSRAARGAHTLTVAALGLAALYTLGSIALLSESRFFGIDEYQYGHATWLVSRGAIPYVDFFEHHFPLSYVLHAPFLLFDWGFASSALLLRKIVLGYLVVAACATGLGTWFATRDASTALLAGFLPASIGFGLMSAIEYRSENFGAFCLLVSLILLESNRNRNRPRPAVLAGVMAGIAACMTQKIALIGGATLGAMWALDAFERVRSGAPRPAFIARPALFIGSAVATGLVVIAVAGVFGMLPAGFDATVAQAAEHERVYERFSIFRRGYVDVYWSMTWRSTVPIVLLGLGYLATPAGRFWALPVAASIVGGALMVAPYPYNFVLLCWIVALAAARGLGGLVGWLASRYPPRAAFVSLLYLLALPAVADQLRYVADAVTNEHQLQVLDKIEKFGAPNDAVIDNAGGAMFSPSATYYFHHGAAHRVMFRDYFEMQLIRDYRESRAMFWIRDLRTKQLPQSTQDYLEAHYIRGDGDLHVLGFETEATGALPSTSEIDVIRAGDYYFHRANPPPREHPPRATDVLLDGRPLRAKRVFLEERVYEVTSLPHSPPYWITPADSAFFSVGRRDRADSEGSVESFSGDGAKRPRFSMLFQHRGRRDGEKPQEEPGVD